MDNSCPATPLVLTETDSKSPLLIPPSSPESEGMKSPSRDSPDSTCVICLGRLKNKSFTDCCLHQFCFQCLLQWSKVKAECPLCKQPFKSIIHNVRSNIDYDMYQVESGEPRCVLSDIMHSFNLDFIQVDRRFRYRSTMTREYFRELAQSFLAHSHSNLMSEDYYQIPPMVPVDPVSTRYQVPNMRQRGTTEFRRNIYNRDLWVQDLADVSGRYRECTPQFYRDNPAQIHRIVPWLNREVNVLLSNCESHAAYILNRMISLLSQHSIRSREFRELVEPYFGSRTDHFIHELYTFARSVYDIAGFDQNAIYGPNPNYATEVQEISSSDNDSDIEIVETIKYREKKSRRTSKEGFKKSLLKRAREPISHEPVAGPSGINSSGKSSEIVGTCDSDTDEVKILDFVKPEPELVILSSGDEGNASDIANNFDVAHSKNEKSNRHRLSESFSVSDKLKKKCKYGKGKCKSNGFGLKGKQKQKYIKSRKTREGSCTSFTSSTSNVDGSGYCVSSSENESDFENSRKFKKKRTKKSRKKSKRKTSGTHSHKTTSSKRVRSYSSSSDKEKAVTKKKKKVKSCVVVPNSKNVNLLLSTPPISHSSDEADRDKGCDTGCSSPTSYWTTVSNRFKNDKWKQEEIHKSKRKGRSSSSEDRSTKNPRHSIYTSSSDESLSDRRCLKENHKISKKIKSSCEKDQTKNTDFSRPPKLDNSPYESCSQSYEYSYNSSRHSSTSSSSSQTLSYFSSLSSATSSSSTSQDSTLSSV